MQAELHTEVFTGNQARKILRLYLAWPCRFDADPDREPELFYAWLKDNYGELTVVSDLQDSESIRTFLTSNPEVIEAAKFLKPVQGKLDSDVRQSRRVRVNTHVFLGIYECKSDPSMIGETLKAVAFDVTRNGLGIEAEQSIPTDTILNVTVAPAGYPIRLYNLTGEVRWASHQADRWQLGLQLFDVEDLERWQADFDQRFGT